MTKFEDVDEAEFSLFKKKLVKLSSYSGKGTELISLYIPEDADRGSVMSQLTEETSQASNIKSPQTRKNVQGALRKIIGFLKTIDFKIPKRGLAIFCGNISEVEGKTDIRLFTVHPIKQLRTKLYWCDSKFHLDPLYEMIQPSDVYGVVAIDKNESTLAIISGKHYEIIGKFTSGYHGKFRAGGWSAKRFEHLREESEHEFYKRISEKMNSYFIQLGDKLKGIIVGGPGMTKNYFLNKELLDHRLKAKIIGLIDSSYTDEYGIREIIQKSDKLLKETDLIKEKEIIDKFMEEISKDGLAIYGEKEINEALEIGKVDRLLISEGLDWSVLRFRCNNCNHEIQIVDKEHKIETQKCEKCNYEMELIEEKDYIDYMLEKAAQTAAEVKVISTESSEGQQFLKAFGGLGALLRYK
ncbi:MAG: peptide chain release factor aRF-1 [Candidatus Diapherotrites archaeon]|nr:peptide chain release factor aRF-1 [Candidatus Diapherotrites archaeon]